jgi:pimeloyl-ACP methyl ester carboxylesterase
MVNRARQIAAQNDPRGAAAMLRGMAQRVESYDIAEELGMPVFIVAGAADQIVPLSEAEEMRRAFPNATLRVMGRSGHVPMLEEAQALGQALLEFAGQR